MTQPTRSHRRRQKARQRRIEKERARLQREQAQAQRRWQALEQALQELGLPATVADEVHWRLQAQQTLMGKIFGMMFPPSVRLSQLSGAVSGAGLGEEPAGPHPGRSAHAEVDQAPAAFEPGSPGTPAAARRARQPGYPESVAVDLGRGRQRLQKVWPATEPGGHLVERPGPSRPARERWPAVARGHRGGQTGGAGGL